MLKRILIVILLAFGGISVTQAQSAQLRIMSLINFPDTAYEGISYPVGFNLKNVGASPYQGPLQILIMGDSVPDVIYFSNNPNFVLLPNDTVQLYANPAGSQGYIFTPQFFRPGNDIVVVWPYTTQSTVIVDTLFTAVYFVPLAAVSEYAKEIAGVYPNPFSGILHIKMDSKESVEQVRIFDSSGRLRKTEKPTENLLDVSYLEAGFYLLEFRTEKKVLYIKVVKE
ncbi:MAG: T9SS type A sorting domain-containing protein [Bacteroidota bacterium]